MPSCPTDRPSIMDLDDGTKIFYPQERVAHA
jgi:hypothetical protein